MSRLDDIERAVRGAHAVSGKPPAEIVSALAPTWSDFSAFDRAELEHRMRVNPPLANEQLAAAEKAREEAATLATEQRQQAEVARITNAQTYRALRQQSPFAAARFAAENPGSYDSEPNDGGPEAA